MHGLSPYQNLVRCHGVFASRSWYLPLLPLPLEAKHDESREDDSVDAAHPESADNPCALNDSGDFSELPSVRPRRLPWARLLKKTSVYPWAGARAWDCGRRGVVVGVAESL